jgi:RHS repeat-associated protein
MSIKWMASLRIASLFTLLGVSASAAAQATLKLLPPVQGTSFVAPATFNLEIQSSDGINGNVYETMEVYWITRNGQDFTYNDAPPSRLHPEVELGPGVYRYSLEGRAMYLDRNTGNERYRRIVSSTSVTVNVDVPYGTLSTSPGTCVIPWGQSTCSTTVSWTSNAPSAQLWVSALDNSNMQLVAQQQSGAVTVNWISAAGQRFHLRNGSYAIATAEAAGTPTINSAPTVSMVRPSTGAIFATGSPVPLAASASDADDGVASVQFRVDGTTVATLGSPPYATQVSGLAPGNHSVVAVATDTRGTATQSTVATFTVAATSATSLTRSYVYDSQQRLCKVVEPETGSTVMEYDAAGNLVWSATGLELPSLTSCDRGAAEASGRVVRRTYDGRNRIATLRFPDHNGDVDYAYAPDGLVSQATAYNDGGSTTATTTYTYNKRRLLTAESLAQAGSGVLSLGYGYSPGGHLASQAYPSGRILDYTPNALGQPRSAGPYASSAVYHPDGSIKQFTYGNGVVHAATLNARHLPLRSSDGNILILQNTYDANANVASIQDLQQGVGYDRAMQYDGRDRLKIASSAMFGGDGVHRFTYDGLDNLKRWTLGGVRDDLYWYDARNRLTNLRNVDGATTTGLSYDVQGNLAAKNGQVYRFDFGNRLREVTGKASYRYDANGRRVRSEGAGGQIDRSFYSNSGQLLYQVNGTTGAEVDAVYLGARPVAEVSVVSGAENVSYLHTDMLGSPVAKSDAAAQLVERTIYSPYGQAVNRAVDGIGYTGHKMDVHSGLIYMQQRYYDPEVGRFLSEDPVSAYGDPVRSFNRYWYANGNPYRFFDPDGRQSIARVLESIFRPVLPTTQRSEPADASGYDDPSDPALDKNGDGRADGRPTGRPTGRPAGRPALQPNTTGPELPSDLVGDSPRPTGKNGGEAIGTSLPSDKFADVVEKLTGGTLSPPNEKGRSVAPNGVAVRTGGKAGPRIDVPANGSKPPEIIHFPENTPIPDNLKPMP